jgi:hypothetical protein
MTNGNQGVREIALGRPAIATKSSLHVRRLSKAMAIAIPEVADAHCVVKICSTFISRGSAPIIDRCSVTKAVAISQRHMRPSVPAVCGDPVESDSAIVVNVNSPSMAKAFCEPVDAFGVPLFSGFLVQATRDMRITRFFESGQADERWRKIVESRLLEKFESVRRIGGLAKYAQLQKGRGVVHFGGLFVITLREFPIRERPRAIPQAVANPYRCFNMPPISGSFEKLERGSRIARKFPKGKERYRITVLCC